MVQNNLKSLVDHTHKRTVPLVFIYIYDSNTDLAASILVWTVFITHDD